jgi:hypothetical protein
MTNGIKTIKNVTGIEQFPIDAFEVEPKQMLILELIK